MKIKITYLLIALITPSLAVAQFQTQMGESLCSVHENVLQGNTFLLKDSGFPVDAAKDSFNYEESVAMRVFLKRVVQAIYTDPVNGKKYLASGKFKKDCIKIYVNNN